VHIASWRRRRTGRRESRQASGAAGQFNDKQASQHQENVKVHYNCACVRVESVQDAARRSNQEKVEDMAKDTVHLRAMVTTRHAKGIGPGCGEHANIYL
jgi:hypothetical protein